MEKKLKGEEGSTLFEMVIYVAILGMIVTSFISFAISISNAKVKVYVVQEVNSNIRATMNIISQKVREAENVITPPSTSTGNTLELNMPNPNLDISYYLNGGILYLEENGETPAAITSSEINITNIEFTNIAATGERDSIKVIVEAEYRDQGSREFKYSNTFQTTVNTRK